MAWDLLGQSADTEPLSQWSAAVFITAQIEESTIVTCR